jgi:large subunit ribosomal protein L2|tara:strand:- start:712 stop:1431 length:720 start_codon:yes stop_codon:yes gene_type:complete
MGKNLIQQARGKGSPRYRSPGFRFKGKVEFAKQGKENITGKVLDLIHCAGHSSPLAQIKYDNGEETLLQAPEGIMVGDLVKSGENVDLNMGNVLPLKNIPEGTSVYNIEINPGDGGKFVRSSGTFAKIVTKMKDKIVVQLPSNKLRDFRPDCRAMIGMIAGSGRKEKPFLKAGKRYFAMKAKNKLWPQTSGTSMNSVDHPFGGSSSASKGRPTQASRNAPPGRKVGKIAPKQTGLSKKR